MAQGVELRMDIRAKRFDRAPQPLFEGLRVDVQAGEVLALIGPSGIGKSTLLRIIAGVDRDFDGRIEVAGRPAAQAPAPGFVFQDPRLLPWLDVIGNIRAVRPDVTDREARDLLCDMELDGQGQTMPSDLSGACSGAWRWPGRWPRGRAFCCWTNPSCRLITGWPRSCGRWWPGRSRGTVRPRSWSATSRATRPIWPTVSSGSRGVPYASVRTNGSRRRATRAAPGISPGYRPVWRNRDGPATETSRHLQAPFTTRILPETFFFIHTRNADTHRTYSNRTGSSVSEKFLLVDPEERLDLIKGLASAVRVSILKLLGTTGPLNVNQIAEALSLPQSTVSSNLQILEDVGLVITRTANARKGSQKICESAFSELLVAFRDVPAQKSSSDIEVSMPIGLYTRCEVMGPCGLCSSEGVIGLLDVPATFLEPERMKAGLLWFTRGFVEYQFPNNSQIKQSRPGSVEFALELSSEVPGTSADWPSDIFLQVNGVDIGTWTSPGDFGDKRGVYTPDWWKLSGSQYGKLKTWRINGDGSYVDGVRVSNVTLADLELDKHRSIRMRIGVHEKAEHPGGINIFGRGFGNYDQDIIMRLTD